MSHAKVTGHCLIQNGAGDLPFVVIDGYRFRVADALAQRVGSIGSFTAYTSDEFAEEDPEPMELDEAIGILGRSPRGIRTLTDIKAFMHTTGTGLDKGGRAALETLIRAYWDQPGTANELVSNLLNTKIN
jgi:hypothetical protein